MYTHPVPKGIPFETLGSTSQTESKAAERAAKLIEVEVEVEVEKEQAMEIPIRDKGLALCANRITDEQSP